MTRAPVRTHRPYEVKKPLSADELHRCFMAADRIGQWEGRLVRFLAWTGAHTVILYADGYDPKVEGEFFTFTRGKNRRDMGVPIKTEMRAWLPDWLAEPRSRDRKYYYRVLAEVGEDAGLRLNFLRLRHTACVIFIRDLHLSPTDVMRLLGVTAETLQIYALRPLEDVGRDMAAAGW